MTSQTPSDRWYYANGNKKAGPVSLARLRRLVAEGVLKPGEMVFQEGTQKWRPLVKRTRAAARTARTGGLWKLAFRASVGVVLLALLGWGLVATLRGPSGKKDVHNPGAVALIGSEPTPTKGSNKQAEKKPLLREDTGQQRPKPQKREESGPINDAQAKATNKQADKESSPRRDNEPQLPKPQKPEDSGPINEPKAKETNKEAQKEPLLTKDKEPQRLKPQERKNSGPTDEAQVFPKPRPTLVVQLGHSGAITSVAFSPDGSQVLTGSSDKTARLWDVASGREIRVFQGHAEPVLCVAFSPDGTQVLTGEGGGGRGSYRVRLWDSATGMVIRAFEPEPWPISSVAFSPDGKQIFTAGSPSAGSWDAASGNKILAFKENYYEHVIFSPDGKQILTGGGHTAGGFLKDVAAVLWDAASRKEILAFKVKGFRGLGSLGVVAFSPDGKQVLTVGSTLESKVLPDNYPKVQLVDSGPKLRLWDAFSGKEIRVFQVAGNSIAFSPDGKRVIADSAGERSFLFDVTSGKLIHTFLGGNVTDRQFESGHRVAFSPDGTQVLTARGSKAVLWDTASGREIRAFQGQLDPVIGVAFSRDGRQVVTKRRSSTALWDTANAKKIRDFKGPWDIQQIFNQTTRNPSECTAVSPDLKQLVSWDIRNTVRLWDAATGKEIRAFQVDTNKNKSFEYVSDVVFSADGKQVLTFCESGSDVAIGLCDVATGKVIRTFIFQPPSNIHSVKSVALSPDGTQLLAYGFNKAFKRYGGSGAVWFVQGLKDNEVWPVALGDQVLWDVASGMAIRVFKVSKSNSNNYLVGSGGFSPNGKLVFGCGGSVFDAASGKTISVLQNYSNVGGAVFFAFSPDGTQVLTGADRTARLWDSASGREIRTFQGHTAAVISAAFSPDGKQVLSGGSDGTVRLWDASSGRELCRQVSFPDGSWAVTTPDNYYMASKGNLQGVAFSVGKRTFGFDQFDLRFNRPDKVLKSIGLASHEMVASYQHAYQKRLKKLDFSEDRLSDDFHVPEIAVNADAKFRTREKTVKLKVKASDSRYLLDRVHVDINGVPLHGTGGISLRKQASKSWQQEVEVELSSGKNKIDVSVLNEKGAESRRETISIQYDAPASKPNLYVVAVGVSDYHDARFRLSYAEKDARDLADLFESKRVRFGEVKVLRILDRDATRENILKAKDFLKGSQVEDLVVVFFAGHGLLDRNLDYYFGTADIDFKDPGKRGLPYEAIEDLLDGIRSRKKLLLMDTCHSGELDKEEVQVVQSQKKTEADVEVRAFRGLDLDIAPRVGLSNSFELLQERFADLRRGTGAVVISSAGGAEYALESAAWKNGVFTHALIRGLRGEAERNRNGHVRVSKLRDFVEQEVRRLTAGRQSPTARRENLEFDFAINTAQLDAFAHTKIVTSVAFSPDGKHVLTGCDDKTARLWDAASGQEIRAFRHIGPVTSVAFSPDGKQVLTLRDKARLWDAANGQEIRAFQEFEGHGPMSVAFSPDGKQVLIGCADKTARLWDVASGQEIRAFQGHTGWVRSVAFSPDGKHVLTGSTDKTARLWDVASGQEIRAFQMHLKWLTGVASVAFSPDGKQVLTCGDKTARLWDAASGQEIRAFQGHTAWVRSVAFSPDGKQVLTGSNDKTARLWDAASGQEIRAFKVHLTGHTGGITSVAFSPDGKQVLTGEGQDGGLGKQVGDRIVSQEDAGRARLWDVATGKEVLLVP